MADPLLNINTVSKFRRGDSMLCDCKKFPEKDLEHFPVVVST